MRTNRGTVLFYVVLILFSSASASPSSLRGRRQVVCADGGYTHEGKTCCKCAAGERVQKHCTTTPDDRECAFCETNTFNSHPNFKETCEPCTSCSQTNANMEEAEICTSARNAKCRCKAGFFCSSGTDSCVVCHPCKTCGDAGVKEACNATSDAVCNEESQDSHINPAAIIVPVILISIVVAAAVVVYFYRRRRTAQPRDDEPGQTGDPLLLQLNGLNMKPTLPDVAGILGWKTMKNVAMRSGVLDTVIESCQRDNPSDAEEQTLALLSKWVEMQGKEAPEKLINALIDGKEKGKAEQVRQVFSSKL